MPIGQSGSIIFVSISLTMPCRNTDAACSITVLRCTRLIFLGGFPLDPDTGSLSVFQVLVSLVDCKHGPVLADGVAWWEDAD